MLPDHRSGIAMQGRTHRTFLAAGTLAVGMLVGLSGRTRSEETTAGPPAEEREATALRRTPLVKLIERVAPSVVDITILKPATEDEGNVVAGTGSVLHSAGYIVTNDHVVRDFLQNRVSLNDGSAYRYRIVATLPYEDLAVIKIQPDRPLQAATLGRSHDLMLGEDVVAIGNSHGLGHTVAPGIISGLDRPVRYSPQVRTIQTNAAVNPGNSGGPLFNVMGQMIGVVAQKKLDADNIGFAIPVDRLREVFPEMMSPRERFGFELGMRVCTMGESPLVLAVDPDSPAEAAGVRVNDEVLQAGNLAAKNGLDFYLALAEQKPGDTFTLQIKRGCKSHSLELTLKPYQPPQPVNREGLRNNIGFAVFEGRWNKLPDFASIEPKAGGVSNAITHEIIYKIRGGNDDDERNEDHFALKFSGFVQVPHDGLYFFYTNSDDGSQLYIHDGLVVDNDDAHGVREAGGQIRLTAGLHPITVTFFERDGAELLEVAIEGPGLPKQGIPGGVLYHRPTEPPPEVKKPQEPGAEQGKAEAPLDTDNQPATSTEGDPQPQTKTAAESGR
jgi:S1-C subfamily serine protease